MEPDRSTFTARRVGRFALLVLATSMLMPSARSQQAPQPGRPRAPAIDVAALPVGDAIVSTQGPGARRLVVFADPECVYCRQLDAVLRQRDDITVQTFLMPILGAASLERAKAIWCATDREAAWRDWMRDGRSPDAPPRCDTSALERNLALREQYAIHATPTLVYADGTRTSGAPGALELERQLALHSAATAPRR